MNTEKDTCQKFGTSVIFQKEITQCSPHCKIYPDPNDWFNDDDDCCGLVKDEQNLPKDIEGRSEYQNGAL